MPTHATATDPRAPLDLSDLQGCAGELRYLHLVLVLASSASAIHGEGHEVTLASLADRCEGASAPSDLVGLSPQLQEILALPMPARLAHVPASLREIASNPPLGRRVDAALAAANYGDGFKVDLEASLIEARDTVFDRLAAALLDAEEVAES